MEFNKLANNLKDQIFDGIFCSLVGKITKTYNNNKIDVKPLYKINGVSLPQVVQVPLLFLGNNKNIVQVESEVGDYVLLIISDYDIDNLVINGKEKEVNTNSKHQINDALAIPFSFTPFNSEKAHTSEIKMNADGTIDILSDSDINITTSNQGDINIDCNTYNVNERGV